MSFTTALAMRLVRWESSHHCGWHRMRVMVLHDRWRIARGRYWIVSFTLPHVIIMEP